MLGSSSRPPNVATESIMTVKVNDPPALSMEVTPQMDDKAAKPTMELGPIPNIYNNVRSKVEETSTRLPYEMGEVEKPRDAGLHGIDRLVQDLLASQKNLEDERRKVAELDAEITRLKEKVAILLHEAQEGGQKRGTEEARVQELERMSALHDEDANELRRLLAFHKTNGERVSRQLRDLQATNKDLQASLKVAEMALEMKQASLLSE
ncbi:hypothetical protein TARUN_8128 [Trichoderma arundinaceum]|uniref:Uncharacterized protein n=1 Tax=Trichoderma arundinaceum TaxID=490622 RepID=A0A395NDE8_TRIAR|nr:hypothetical protein TARUN_8128 [Trichoderma arundinaceum]